MDGNIELKPGVMLWYEVIGFLDLDPRHSVFKHLKTDMRSQYIL